MNYLCIYINDGKLSVDTDGQTEFDKLVYALNMDTLHDRSTLFKVIFECLDKGADIRDPVILSLISENNITDYDTIKFLESIGIEYDYDIYKKFVTNSSRRSLASLTVLRFKKLIKYNGYVPNEYYTLSDLAKTELDYVIGNMFRVGSKDFEQYYKYNNITIDLSRIYLTYVYLLFILSFSEKLEYSFKNVEDFIKKYELI